MTIVALVVGTLVGIAFVAGLVALAVRRGARKGPDIPQGMRPGPADEVLERRQLERVMGWGVAFTLFFAAWLPVYWLGEPNRNVSEEEELIQRAVTRGGRWFQVASEENPTGFGCANCHGAEAQGGSVPFTAPDGTFVPDYPAPALTNVCARLTVEDIRTTIMEGREGTPMPSWSVRAAGPMNDQQINDLVNYLVSIQDVPEDQNLCTNPAAAAEAGEDTDPEDGASPTPTEP